MQNDLENRAEKGVRKRGHPSNAEIAARGAPQETVIAVDPKSRSLPAQVMRCCGRAETPRKIRDEAEYTLAECPGCGKRLHIYPMRQVVL